MILSVLTQLGLDSDPFSNWLVNRETVAVIALTGDRHSNKVTLLSGGLIAITGLRFCDEKSVKG